MRRIIRPGDKYGMLTFLYFHERKSSGKNLWLVKCDCGVEKIVVGRDVISGHTKSCGCSTSEMRQVNRKDTYTRNGKIFTRHKSGDRHGMFVLLYLARKETGTSKWMVRCDCGNEKTLSIRDIVNGHTRSCGCATVSLRNQSRKTHKMSHTKEFRTWCHIIERCRNPNCSNYKNYGGRGISVCDRWLESFENFYEDMGNCPNGLSLDRINNNGNYEPGNCRWATNLVQAQNKRNVRKVILQGKNVTVFQAERILGLGSDALDGRARRSKRSLQEICDELAAEVFAPASKEALAIAREVRRTELYEVCI